MLLELDHDLLLAAAKLGGTSPTRDAIVHFLAEILPWLLLLAAVYLGFTGKTKRQRELNHDVLLGAVVAGVFAVIIRGWLAEAFGRLRPFERFHDFHHLTLQFSGSGQYGFPSGHAFVLFAVSSVVFFSPKHRTLGIVLLLLSTVVVMARVVAGVHYPSDIVGGVILGTMLGWFIDFELRWLRKQMR